MGFERYLLIDAYNVICSDALLSDALRQNMDSARDQLAERVVAIHDAEAIRVALILDSQNDQLHVQHPYKKKTFEYIYAPAAISADGIIERIVHQVDRPELVSVVSNDNLVREATRAMQAVALRPDDLFEWSAGCERRLIQSAKRRNQQNARDFRNGIEIDIDLS